MSLKPKPKPNIHLSDFIKRPCVLKEVLSGVLLVCWVLGLSYESDTLLFVFLWTVTLQVILTCLWISLGENVLHVRDADTQDKILQALHLQFGKQYPW